MTKAQVRILKSHYGPRWHLYRYNSKNTNKKLLLEEKFIINNTLPGPVFAHKCLGEIYQGILDVHTQYYAPVPTVLLINNVEFKYKTIDELITMIADYKKYLVPNGRIIVTFSLSCIKYDRLNISVDSLCDWAINLFKKQQLACHKHYVNIKNSTHGIGQIFLSLDYHV
tara:strand:- start:827 stop:1333 length:507 start_codon:yes stop_codon:yes gene_type:complete